MKKLMTVSLSAIIVAGVLLLSGCQKKVPIGGTIVDTKGERILQGRVVVYSWPKDGKEPAESILEFKEGKLAGEVALGSRYVVNIKAKGYGLVSKVFYDQLPDRTYELKKATVTNINPAMGGVAADNQNNCPGSQSFRTNWAANPMAGVPLEVNAAGNITGFGMPDELREAYYFHATQAFCNNGIQVTLPPNTIAAPGPVSISMSSIDLFAPDGMPGDNAAEFDGRPAFMESLGAFSLDIYDEEKDYNLVSTKEQKEPVRVSFPARLYSKGSNYPPTVPLLSYNEKSGIWIKEGEATLDTTTWTYVGRVTHFSAVNLDMEKNTPACLQFENNPSAGGLTPTFKVEVTVPPTSPGPGLPSVATRDIDATLLGLCSNNFALTRLPQNTPASVVFFDNSASPPAPKAHYVLKTGATNPILVDRTRPNCTDLADSPPCGTPVQLNTGLFGTNDFMVAACQDGVNLIVSFAYKSGAAFDPADFELAFAGGTGSCASSVQLGALFPTETRTANPPLVNFNMLKYSITCTATTVKIQLVGNPAVGSNTFTVVNCQ